MSETFDYNKDCIEYPIDTFKYYDNKSRPELSILWTLPLKYCHDLKFEYGLSAKVYITININITKDLYKLYVNSTIYTNDGERCLFKGIDSSSLLMNSVVNIINKNLNDRLAYENRQLEFIVSLCKIWQKINNRYRYKFDTEETTNIDDKSFMEYCLTELTKILKENTVIVKKSEYRSDKRIQFNLKESEQLKSIFY